MAASTLTRSPRVPQTPAPKLLARSVGCLIGGAILMWIAAHAGSLDATVIVHVTEPHVVVGVGAQSFRIGDDMRHAPLVCVLPAGTHRLTMTRDGVLLHDETFTVSGGEERVLFACRTRTRPLRSGRPAGPTPRPPR
jgi:hypothetical protein